MSRNYKFHNAEGTYFISFAVLERLDVFTRNEYKDVIIDSLHYCQKEKGMLDRMQSCGSCGFSYCDVFKLMFK